MTDDHLKWLRGPLPPLSDSILQSGLVNDPSLQTSNHLQQAVFGSSPIPLQKKSKKSVKQPFVVESKQKKEKPNKFVKETNAAATTAANTMTIVPPPPDVPQNYKPPPVEQIFEQNRSKSSVSRAPLIGEPKKATFRSEINQIMRSLDSSIAEIAPITATSMTPDEHAELMSKMLQIYNFHFNQLILQEKESSSDYALMLRRFQQFYNQFIVDIPTLRSNFEGTILELQKRIRELESELEIEKNIKKSAEERNLLNDKTIEELRKNIERLTKESQEKDIRMQNQIDEQEFQKGKMNQLNFKINSLNEEIVGLKRAIAQRDEEIQRGMDQNEENTRILAKFQEGQTGYIVVYHEEKAKREKAEEEIKELQKKIHGILNKPKADKCVDTTDIPQKKMKKKRGAAAANANAANATNSSSLLCNSGGHLNEMALSSSCRTTAKNSASDVSMVSASISDEKIQASIIIHDSVETQTSPREKAEKQAPCNAGSGFIDILTQTDESLLPTTTKIVTVVKKEEEIMDSEEKLKLPQTHTGDFDHLKDDFNQNSIAFQVFDDMPSPQSLKSVPDLLATMTPFLSQISIHSGDPQELQSISLTTVGKHTDKPLVWGLQIVHNFLTDSFTRSIHNTAKLTIESIFVDWLSHHYKLQHLVNQVICDFSFLLLSFNSDKFLKLFVEVLESRFTFPQVCFLATIYSFSVHMTKPSFLEMLQGAKADTSTLKIHIRFAYEILAKSLNPSIADAFLANRATKENPYIDYIDFLRQATTLFGDKHEMIHSQAKNLLRICGCNDFQNIQNDTFCAFFCFLGLIDPVEMKHDWKFVQKDNSTSLQKILSLCSDKKTPLMKLLTLRPLTSTVKQMKDLPALLNTLYLNFIKRFTETMPNILKVASDDIQEKTKKYQEDVKNALINVDIQAILWNYKQFLVKFETMCLKEKKFIPISPSPNDQMISGMIEYYDRSESVSFAFVNV